MTRNVKTVLALALLCLVGVAGAALAQEKQQAPPAGMPPPPQPGPEHAVLKNDVGVWDATVEMTMGPGAPPSVSKGVETNSLVGNGMWLVTDFKSDMMGQAFQGHGISGYDTAKKKYVSTWADSMSTGLNLGESTYDSKTKTMVGWMEGPDPSGKIVKSRSVVEYKDPNTRTFTMYTVGPDGKEFQMMKITYRRRP